MSDAGSALSSILDPLLLIFSTIARIPWTGIVTRLAQLIAIPIRALLVVVVAPLRILLAVLLAVLSPAVHVFSFFVACGRFVGGTVAALQPLYTFFGVAALIGISLGLLLSSTSHLLSSRLGVDSPPSRKRLRDTTSPASSAPLTPSSDTTDWQWGESSSTSPMRSRFPAGLLSQTILEEDDD